jgi:hypothetical protein
MSGKERRLSPRKACSIPIRFRTFASEFVPVMAEAAVAGGARSVRTSSQDAEVIDGEAVNLSERGISFKSSYKFQVGESVEMYFTLPRELTGRRPEEVRCNARVVHIDASSNGRGSLVGATIDRFEPLRDPRRWQN